MLTASFISCVVFASFAGNSYGVEDNCKMGTIQAKCFKCLTCTTIITSDQICDGKFDCRDITDEFLCSQKRNKYQSQLHYIFALFQPIPWDSDSAVELAQRMCIPDCPLHESHRKACEHCKPGHIQCSPYLGPNDTHHTCIGKKCLCNGVRDCPNGEDELYCGPDLLKNLPEKTNKTSYMSGSGSLQQTLDPSQEEIRSLDKVQISCSLLEERTHRMFNEEMERAHRPPPIGAFPPPRMGLPPHIVQGWIRSNSTRGMRFPQGPPPHVQQAWMNRARAPQTRMGGTGPGNVLTVGFGMFALGGQEDMSFTSIMSRVLEEHLNVSAEQAERSPAIETDRICDGTSDCPGKVDELICRDKFYCKGESPLYVEKSRVLDGVEDCDDGSDEAAQVTPKFVSRYNLIDNWTLQVLVWIMAFTALIGNLLVICNTTVDLIKHNRVATATALLRSRRTSVQEVDPKNGKTKLSRVSVSSIRTTTTGSSRFRSVGSGISGHRRLVRIWNSVLVLNLATADLIMGVYLMCLAVMSFLYEEESQSHHQYGSFDREWRTSSTCQVLGTMLVISSQTSVYTLVSLTSLRLHTVLRPFSSYHLKFRYLTMAVLGTWSVALISAVAPILPSLRDFFVQDAWVPFPQFQPPVINRTTADALVRGIAYITNTNITDNQEELNSTLSWNTMLSFVKQVAPSHSDWHFYSYYSEDSVCMPKLYADQNDPFWKHALANIVINFASVLYISCAYITIYCKSAKEGRSARQFLHDKKKRPQTDECGKNWKRQSAVTRRDRASIDQRKTGGRASYMSRRGASSNKKNRRTSRNSISEMQRRIALLVITDCVCWIPICIMSFCSVSGLYIPDTAFAITAIGLLPINSALNPLLYSRVLQTLWSRGLSSLRVRVASVRQSFESSDSSIGGGKQTLDKKLSSISGITVEESFPSDDPPSSGRVLPIAEIFSPAVDNHKSSSLRRSSIHNLSRLPLEAIQEHPTAIEVS